MITNLYMINLGIKLVGKGTPTGLEHCKKL